MILTWTAHGSGDLIKRHCSIKIRVKRKKKNWWLIVQPLPDVYKTWEWFKGKEIACHIDWNQEISSVDISGANKCYNDIKRKVYCAPYSNWRWMKIGSTTITQNVKIYELSPENHQNRRRSRLFMDPSLCSVLSETSWMYWTMSCSNLTNQSQELAKKHNWCVYSHLLKEIGLNVWKDSWDRRARIRHRPIKFRFTYIPLLNFDFFWHFIKF